VGGSIATASFGTKPRRHRLVSLVNITYNCMCINSKYDEVMGTKEGYGEIILVILGFGAEAAAPRVHHCHIRYQKYNMKCFPIQIGIPLTITQIIRSVSFEESEANSTRTISLDSSTIVDDMSKITSLIPLSSTSIAHRDQESKRKESSGDSTLEATMIFPRRSEQQRSMDWSEG